MRNIVAQNDTFLKGPAHNKYQINYYNRYIYHFKLIGHSITKINKNLALIKCEIKINQFS